MSKDKRVQKRVDVNIDVAVSHESRLQKLYSKNISRGGIYLATDDLIPIGKKVTLSFFIKPLNRTVSIEAEVVHHHSCETFDDEAMAKTVRGMGLKFMNVSEEDQKIIDSYIMGKELTKGA